MPLESSFPEVFIKDVPVHQLILESILEYGTATAFINSETGKKLTFQDVYVKSHQIAHGLYKNGFQHGDIVTLCMPNAPTFSYIMLGILLRGGVVSSVNSLCTEEELQRHFENSTSKFIFTNHDLLTKVGGAATKLGNQIKKIFVLNVENKKVQLPKNVDDFDTLLSYAPKYDLPQVKFFTKTDLAFLPYSSGTTGFPKGVMLSHYNITAMLHVLGLRAFFLTPTKGDHNVGILPFFHIFGLVVLLNSMKDGITTVTVGKFDSAKFFSLIQKYKVPIIYVVPPILVLMAKDDLVKRYDISSVYGVCVGAAPVGKELSLELIEKHPNIKYLCQGYGMTEMGCASHVMPVTPLSELKHGSCGMLLPNFECKVVDLETGKELGANEKGEICVKSVCCMLGYFNNSKATDEICDEDGWLHSGDIGYYDDEGHFFVIDRCKELIKVKGFQVPPAELEDLLLSHNEIKDAAVIGISDLAAGEVPRAYIVREPNSRLTENQVQEYVDTRVAPYKKLKGGVQFVEEIPKSASGKILRRFLRDEFAKSKKNIAKL